MTDPLIRVEGLYYTYGAASEVPVEALRGIDLAVRPGEWLALVGHNGSGKSTLAKCLNGLLLPTAGEVWVKGLNTREREHWLEIRQTVGIVFQNPDNQFVATTVEEEVAFGPENLGLSPATLRERVDEALEIAGLVESRQANPHDLSAGQKGRLAIASILAMRPECLILDEATAFLDPLAREGILDLLARLHEQGMTLIMATHNMDEATLADRIVALEGGRIALEAKPREFFARQADLEQLGLGVPTVVAVVSALHARGVDLPPDLLTEHEVAEALLGAKERLWAR